MKNTPPKAAIYVRQSAGDEEVSNSIDEQIAACKLLASTKGFDVIDPPFADYNTSGTTYPAGAESFAEKDITWKNYIKENKHVGKKPFRDKLGAALRNLPHIDYLIVYDSTRLMRPLPNSYLGNYISQLLISNNVTLLSCHDGEVDFQRFDSKLIQTIREQVEADAKEKLRTRSKRGMMALKDSGYTCGHPMTLGYNRTGKQAFSIDEKEAAIVRRIFASYMEKRDATNLYRDLNAEGIRSKRGGVFKHSTILRVLRNPCYCGMAKNCRGDLIPSKVFPPIISKEDWLSIQSLRNKSLKEGRSSKFQHYFAGLCKCGSCGRPMYFATSPSLNRHQLIRCSHGTVWIAKKDRKRACIKAQINEHLRWDMDVESLHSYGLAESLMPLTVLAIAKHARDLASREHLVDNRIELENELHQVEVKERELNAAWLINKLSVEAYTDMTEVLKNRKDEIKHSLAAVGDGVMNVFTRAMLTGVELHRKIKALELRGQELSDMLHSVLKRIEIHEWHMLITLFDGSQFKLERVRKQSGRSSPAWTLELDGSQKWIVKYYYLSWYHNQAWHIDLETGNKTPDTEAMESIIYESTELRIIAVGANR